MGGVEERRQEKDGTLNSSGYGHSLGSLMTNYIGVGRGRREGRRRGQKDEKKTVLWRVLVTHLGHHGLQLGRGQGQMAGGDETEMITSVERSGHCYTRLLSTRTGVI